MVTASGRKGSRLYSESLVGYPQSPVPTSHGWRQLDAGSGWVADSHLMDALVGWQLLKRASRSQSSPAEEGEGYGFQGPAPSRLGWLKVGTGDRMWVVVEPRALPHGECRWAVGGGQVSPEWGPLTPVDSPPGSGVEESGSVLRGEGPGPDGFPLESLLWVQGGGRGATKSSQRAEVKWVPPLFPEPAGPGLLCGPCSQRSLSKDFMLRPSLGGSWGLGASRASSAGLRL